MAKKKDANFPNEDAPEHTTRDFYAAPHKRPRNYRDIELLTPEKRKAKNDKETSDALRYGRPLPSRTDDIIEKYNRKVTGERNKDIELKDDSDYPGSFNQLDKLHKKHGKVTGLEGRETKSLNEAEKNKVYETDMRDGKPFYTKPLTKRKKSVASY